MTSPQAILSGAALIAATIVFVHSIQPARAQQGGPYMLMHHSNTVANAGVFRLDQSSGEVSYCFVSGANDLVCSRPVR